MSTLQISLAVAGGLVLAGVVAHSAWSARKNQPKRATPEASTDQPPAQTPEGEATDTLAERQEPSFDADSGMGSLSSLANLMAIEKKPGLDARDFKVRHGGRLRCGYQFSHHAVAQLPQLPHFLQKILRRDTR